MKNDAKAAFGVVAGIVVLAGSITGGLSYFDGRYAMASEVQRQGAETRADIIRSEIRTLERRSRGLRTKREAGQITSWEQIELEDIEAQLDDLRARVRALEGQP